MMVTTYRFKLYNHEQGCFVDTDLPIRRTLKTIGQNDNRLAVLNDSEERDSSEADEAGIFHPRIKTGKD